MVALTEEQPETGERYFIKNPNHPWYKYAGTLGKSFKTVLGEKMWYLRLDNGCNAGVTPEDLDV